jgi:hypothetical protein
VVAVGQAASGDEPFIVAVFDGGDGPAVLGVAGALQPPNRNPRPSLPRSYVKREEKGLEESMNGVSGMFGENPANPEKPGLNTRWEHQA